MGHQFNQPLSIWAHYAEHSVGFNTTLRTVPAALGKASNEDWAGLFCQSIDKDALFASSDSTSGTAHGPKAGCSSGYAPVVTSFNAVLPEYAQQGRRYGIDYDRLHWT
jgi:hypothetical protein